MQPTCGFARVAVGVNHWSGERHRFVSQHSNHRSDHIQPTRVPKVEAILLWDAIEGNNCLYWRIARPLDDNGQEQGISCRSNRNVPHGNCYRFWIGQNCAVSCMGQFQFEWQHWNNWRVDKGVNDLILQSTVLFVCRVVGREFTGVGKPHDKPEGDDVNL